MCFTQCVLFSPGLAHTHIASASKKHLHGFAVKSSDIEEVEMDVCISFDNNVDECKNVLKSRKVNNMYSTKGKMIQKSKNFFVESIIMRRS